MASLKKRVGRLDVGDRKIWKAIADLEAAIASNTAVIASLQKEVSSIEMWITQEVAWRNTKLLKWQNEVTDAFDKQIKIDLIDWKCVADKCPASPLKPQKGAKTRWQSKTPAKILDIDPPQTGPDWPVTQKNPSPRK
jgi:hypothetical protein